MGARHADYGALPEHYPVVGTVLIGAMAEVGGRFWRDSWTAAWEEAFGAVAGAMIEGAEEKLALASAA